MTRYINGRPASEQELAGATMCNAGVLSVLERVRRRMQCDPGEEGCQNLAVEASAPPCYTVR